jgi:hypothetical protein
MFGPLSPIETRQFLLQCAARAAQIKGLVGAEWYLEIELKDYLEKNHPETLRIFNNFADAYLKWATLTYEYNDRIVQGKLDPETKTELASLKNERDSTRKAILAHLGIQK